MLLCQAINNGFLAEPSVADYFWSSLWLFIRTIRAYFWKLAEIFSKLSVLKSIFDSSPRDPSFLLHFSIPN